MSIVWLESFVLNMNEVNIFTFQSLNIVIYLNLLSILAFTICCFMFKLDNQMQKPPNTLLILKMFGETLVSVHLLILFLCFSFENNKRKIETTSTIIYMTSLLSPSFIFLAYYFNACLAHNLYITFYTYKNNFHKRIYYYQISALVFSILIFFISLMFNNKTHFTTLQFSVSYYSNFYLGLFYFSGGILCVYIITKIFYVQSRKQEFFSFLNQGHSEQRKDLITQFVKKHILYLILFLVCYFPNNLILIIQIFSKYKICNECQYYSFVVYLMSSSCLISFLIKLSEPYMRKYLQIVMVFLQKRQIRKLEEFESGKDYSALYVENNPNNMLEKKNTELHDIYRENENLGKNLSNDFNMGPGNPLSNDSYRRNDLENSIKNGKKPFSKISNNNLTDLTDTFDIMNKEMQSNDFFTRLIAINLSIEEDKSYDFDINYSKKMKAFLPWEDTYYNGKSKFQIFSGKNMPEWLKVSNKNVLTNMRVKIRKYAPAVFHHIRKIDEISVKDCLNSLDPDKNLKIINESFASGGRSANPIIFTHDKKFLLKTISKSEKNILLKLLPEFHRRMRDLKSYLCRIYGVFRIKLGDKEDVHILLMKNMCDLSNDSKFLCFDLKGSTRDRSTFEIKDKEMIANGKQQEVIEKFKKKVLKDNDFTDLKMQFKLSKKDANNLIQNISLDADFLKGYNLTDYSLFVTIHKFSEEEANKTFKNYRINKSLDQTVLYNFSIIDFLCEYDVSKAVERTYKKHFTGGSNDINISAQNALAYSRRLVRFISSNILDDETN